MIITLFPSWRMSKILSLWRVDFLQFKWSSSTNSTKVSYINSIWLYFMVSWNRVYKVDSLRSRKDSFGVWLFLEEFPTFSGSGPLVVICRNAYGVSGYISQMDGDLVSISWPRHGHTGKSSLGFVNMLDPRFCHCFGKKSRYW